MLLSMSNERGRDPGREMDSERMPPHGLIPEMSTLLIFHPDFNADSPHTSHLKVLAVISTCMENPNAVLTENSPITLHFCVITHIHLK